MSDEIITALLTAGGTIISLTAGYVIWSVKRLTTDVGQMKIDLAKIGVIVLNIPSDHDKLILTEAMAKENAKDIAKGFQSVRNKLNEFTSEH